MRQNKIFYGKSVHGNEEIKAVVSTIKNSTQMGKNVSKFEANVSKLFYKKYGVMVNSGSSAIHLLFDLLNLPKKSEIILPSLNFATPISSIVKFGLIPNFVDVKLQTLCIDEEKIESSINKNTKAIVVPNLIGSLPDWKKLRQISNKYNLLLIEDSADTMGAKIDGQSTGKYSDFSICSFYGSHIINCAGNGGILCLNKKKDYLKALILRSWGRDSSIFKESEKIENRFKVKLGKYDYDAKFLFSELGYNFEPSEIGASFGNVQLKKLSHNLKVRNKHQRSYENYFNKRKKYFHIIEKNKKIFTSYLAFPVILNDGFLSRKKLQIFLEKNSIQTRVIFTGNITLHPCMKNIKHIINKFGLKNSNTVAKNGILLPCHHGLKEKDIDKILLLLDKFIINLGYETKKSIY